MSPHRHRGSFNRGRRLGSRRSLHAHILPVVDRRKLGAVERHRPGEPELVEDWLAALADPLAERAAGPDGVAQLLRAHGRVGGAEEEGEAGGAAVLDQGRESGELVGGVTLRVVPNEVRHPRHVVTDRRAGVDRDGFALADLDRTGGCLVLLWMLLSQPVQQALSPFYSIRMTTFRLLQLMMIFG